MLSALARLLVVVERPVGMVVQDVPLGGSRVCGGVHGVQVIHRHYRRGRGSVLYRFRLLHWSRFGSSRPGIAIKIGVSHVASAGKSRNLCVLRCIPSPDT